MVHTEVYIQCITLIYNVLHIKAVFMLTWI